MNISKDGVDLIKGFEGFSAIPYNDTAGLLTIGFGHLIQKGEIFGAISSLEAQTLLCKDTKQAVDCVNTHVQTPLTQHQFDALVSFVYNVGCKKFSQSTLLKLLNENDTSGASLQFQRWNHAGGVVSSGLTRRRKKEMEMFNGEG